MTAAKGDLRVQRWAPAKFEIPCEGFDFTGQAITMQVRAYRDSAGDPLIDLAATTPPAQGVSLSVETVEGLATTTIQIRINETVIEGLLPFPERGGEPDQEVVLFYAVHVGSGAAKRRFLEGRFIIEAGANHA